MAFLSPLKEKLRQLEDGPASGLLALASSVVHSTRNRSPTIIFKDRDGDWINRQREGTFVSPRYSSISYAEVRDNVRDLWFYETNLPGATVVDVGAGLGDDVVVISKLVGSKGRVVAIEAHPGTFRQLEKTIRLNNLSNVHAINRAVSDHEHETMISNEEEHIGNRLVSTGGIQVKAETLDLILGRIDCPAPDLLKINIEGAEVAALRGTSTTLLKARHWVVSCHDFLAEGPGPSSFSNSCSSRCAT